ncbi:MAG: alpha/beta hydrolase [Acidobacteriia bacterium]|nr:alpha/beta hydrolase [Terriglobia bacterium]
MYWMITNRNITGSGLGDKFADLSFWKNESKNATDFAAWKQLKLDEFRQALVQVSDTFPDPTKTGSEDQKHVNIFVHGFDNSWSSAAGTYANIVAGLFSGAQSLGECVLFTWPSQGSPLGYFPDRSEARQSAEDFADVLSELYDWMAMKQKQAAKDPTQACRAMTSVIAHSMGNYVLENAMNVAWTRKNRPLLMSLINQLLMVAADVDNDLFRSGEQVEHGDGEGIANLCYRVTALYTGRDAVLGASAGLKHFGKRRLGRSGLDRTYPLPDNVWDVDCSPLIATQTSGLDVHSAYFHEPKCYDLMRSLLRGVDRGVLARAGSLPSVLPKTQGPPPA